MQQLAVESGHPERAGTNLGLFGFSAAGVLALTTAETMPERVLTVVTYAAGSAPLELRQLTPLSALQQVPVMLLANGDDSSAGTSGSQQYFAKGREMGAASAPVAVDGKSGLRGTFLCTSDGVDDRLGQASCAMTTVAVESAAAATAAGTSPDAWLPDASFGQSWVDWIAASKTIMPNP